MDASGWFGVRSVVRFEDEGDVLYEERVTLWRAGGLDEADAIAESEAERYAAVHGGESLGLVQAYAMADEPGAGAEVFSLMRASNLGPTEYLDAFFDTGSERQERLEHRRDRLSPGAVGG